MNPPTMITGQRLTSAARELWIEQDYVGAIELLMQCGIPKEKRAIEICIGRAKLEGNSYSGFKLKEDSSSSHFGVKLFGIMEAFRSQTKNISGR